MQHISLNNCVEKFLKKITTFLIFSFGVLLYVHHGYRSNLFQNQEIDVTFFRNQSYQPHVFSQFFTLFSCRISKSQKDFYYWNSVLNSSRRFDAPTGLESALSKVFPHALKSFSLRWNSLNNFMHGLRLQNILPHHRVLIRDALISLSKKKVLTRAIAGKEVRIFYLGVGEEKHLSFIEIPMDLVTTKKIFIDKEKFRIETIKDSLVSFVMRTQGVVTTSLLSDLRRKRLPSCAFRLATSFLEASKIPLRQHYGRGSQFFILYRGVKNARTGQIECKDILFLKLKNTKRNVSLYPYSLRKNAPGLFTENGERVNQAKEKSGLSFIRPLSGGRLSSYFGKRKHPIFGYHHHHKGIDLAAPLGTPVRAAASGVVEKVGWVRGYGNFIRIRHSNDYRTAYGHLSRYAQKLRPGTTVYQGQVIGFVGSTGNASGNHLHFEMIRNGSQINPMSVHNSAQPIERMGGLQYQRFRAYIRHLNAIYNKLGNNGAAT
ncbi:M23 family metallopeptidase [Holospora undulata]|uniref:Putative metalloprotease n=1 Tax=Holospora undulata HU1 TaxID=1321371 RepID=A0A061JHD9_9PROT|nr:M23 family metallopeptidase [Holospora undulata]ETZ04737.1 putative metalloprotease [Holospora undulata HU1]